MPRWNIDNLMTHVAAAALIVDDFEVDVNDLREDLKIENKEYVMLQEVIVHSTDTCTGSNSTSTSWAAGSALLRRPI
jgi:hypothetical protein